MRLLSEALESLWIAWDAIRANKLRAGLTTLGIIIGIVTVTLMGTAIQGLRRGFTQSIAMLGTDNLYVQRFDWFINSREQWMEQNRRRSLNVAQFREFERQMVGALAVAPEAETFQPVRREKRNASSVRVVGTTEQFLLTAGLTVAQGRFLTREEARGGRPVCVLGASVADSLFLHGSPLGQRVDLGGRPFEVVGVLDRLGEFLGAFNLDNQVMIPLEQFRTTFWHDPDLTIQVKAGAVERLDEVREEVRGLMRKIRRVRPGQPDDFAINQQDQFLKTFNRVIGTIASVGLFITGLSLFVGGIGIMNIMFVSVAERTKEIGIRKAIGAKRRAILLQFLIEAAAICLFGGLIGLAIAWPVTLLLQRVLPATMSPLIVSVAIGVSLLTGVVAGFLPAWRAARLNPVDALRNE
ncbi:MAG: ABC transporter permease [Verrucomicrobia bacterium]|nr:ABC transporter permease [Verrucomicrobiota bacterium]